MDLRNCPSVYNKQRWLVSLALKTAPLPLIAYLCLIYLLASLLNLAVPLIFLAALKTAPLLLLASLCSIHLWKINFLPLLLTSTWYSFEIATLPLLFNLALKIYLKEFLS